MFTRFLKNAITAGLQQMDVAPMDYRIKHRRNLWRAVRDYDAEVINLSDRAGGAALIDWLHNLDLNGKVVADLGCGPGHFLPALKGASKIYAIDWAENLLDQARSRGPGQTTYVTTDIRQLKLPEPMDLVLCINALMPESHQDALALIRKMLSLLKPDGLLLLVVPSWESFMLGYNLVHFAAAAQGKEGESERAILARFRDHFNNPFGYIRYTDETYRHWLHDELLLIPSLHFNAKVQNVFRLAIRWSDVLPNIQFADVTPPPWLWGAIIQHKGEAAGAESVSP
ncbi:MAG: class I SAM-dependent methyltransferase [Alphaproteobacteria bacterium]|nr:class I SAM-dependent methyltransferase [Alphaproteobacteria bacterium]